jgi:alkanesulfonate monooxygenase SsuD/methylene tetrahydromethanopterin reductase-like flavin-dependent oxidoreductase (luciferase family)
MAAATVDALSHGRFRLGIGSSHRVQVVDEHGLAYSEPIAQVRETIEIARRIWTDPTATYDGLRIAIAGFDLWFEPERREIPIYVGALNPKMLRLSGALADGVILTRATLDHVRSANALITAAAEQAGRDPASIDRAVLIPCALHDDPGTARDMLRPGFAMYAARFPRYRELMERAGFAAEVAAARVAWEDEGAEAAAAKLPDDLIDAMALAGPADRIQAGLALYREAGTTLPILAFATTEPKGAVQARRLIDAMSPLGER